jgi:chromate transporter
MIYLRLFLTFLKIGAISFGGGYGMISLIRDDCLSNGWLSEAELLNFIAVAESTPGPIAVNMATFVGTSQGGVLGGVMATLGVVLPSFVIILLVASVLTRLLQYGGVRAAIGGIKPAITGLIIGTAITMLLSLVFGVKHIQDPVSFDLRGILVLAVIVAIAHLYKRIKKAEISPIVLIIISGLLGVMLYGF